MDELARVAEAPVGVLGTVGAGGRPHLVPMVFAVTAGEIVSAIDWKPKHGRRLQRLVNIDATPTVSFLTHHYSDDWGELWWVRVDGVAATHTAGPAWAAAIDALRMKYDQYRDRPPEGEVIRIRVEAVASWSSTG